MMASQLLEEIYKQIDRKQRGEVSHHYHDLTRLQKNAKQLQEIILKGDRPLTRDEQLNFSASNA
jgi:hypothetical protein